MENVEEIFDRKCTNEGYRFDNPKVRKFIYECMKEARNKALTIHSVVVPKGTCCLNPKRISHVTVAGITHSTCENCKEEIV